MGDVTVVKGPASAQHGPEAGGRGLDILVVDDEVNIGNLLRDALARHGHRVITFTDGQHAIEEARHRRFDVVFLDIRMPGMSGTQALKTLRGVLPKAIFIMITGGPESELADEPLGSGAFMCLSKPLSIVDVVDLVESFGRE